MAIQDPAPFSPLVDEAIANPIRKFSSGADRDLEDGKLDFAAVLSPEVLGEFAEYMLRKSVRNDGTRRSGNNWKKGIPLNSYMSSMWRHFMDVWQWHEEQTKPDSEAQLECLMALLFNVQGYAHELIKEINDGRV